MDFYNTYLNYATSNGDPLPGAGGIWCLESPSTVEIDGRVYNTGDVIPNTNSITNPCDIDITLKYKTGAVGCEQEAIVDFTCLLDCDNIQFNIEEGLVCNKVNDTLSITFNPDNITPGCDFTQSITYTDIEYNLDNQGWNPFTSVVNLDLTEEEINFAIVIDISGSSTDYIEAQKASLINFITGINNNTYFSNCENINLSLIPHGIGAAIHCDNPLVDISHCQNDCICATGLYNIKDNFSDFIDFINDLDNANGNYQNCPGQGLSACFMNNNNDVQAIVYADSVLSGLNNSHFIYFTDGIPLDNGGFTPFVCSTFLNPNCCDEVISEVQNLDSSITLYGVFLGDLLLNGVCGVNGEWLNTVINNDLNDSTNVFNIPDPSSSFNLVPIINSLEDGISTSYNFQVRGTLQPCNVTGTYSVNIDICNPICV